MSFLLRILPRQSATLTSRHGVRTLSTTPAVRKTPVETAKDTIKGVDKTVSQAAVKGIEKGEQAAASLKSSASSTTSEAKGKASEVAGETKGKASEIKGEAKGKVEEVKGKLS